MFRSGGTATATATIGTAGEMTPPSASAQVALRSAHDSAAAWRPPRSSGTTAARSPAGSAVATKRKGRLRGRRQYVTVLCPQAGTRNERQALFRCEGSPNRPPRKFIIGDPREKQE